MIKKLLSYALSLVIMCTLICVDSNYKVFAENNVPKDVKVYCDATLEDEFAEDSVIVVLNKNSSDINRKLDTTDFSEIECADVKELSAVKGDPSSKEYLNTEDFQQILQIKLKEPSKKNVLETIKKLETLDEVESAEPNYLFAPSAEASTNDTTNSIEKQKDAEFPNATPNDSQYSSQYSLKKISAPSAWNITTGSNTIKVGIIDSGISNHPDLNANLTTGWDFFNNNSTTTDDLSGHGTHVAGIIGAVGNNRIGVSGICWNVSLVPLQVMNPNKFLAGKKAYLDGSAIIAAIQYAANYDIPIINLSLGSISNYNAYETAMENYKGLMVCSAGNESNNNDINPHYPASSTLPNIISVASTNSNDILASDSNYGSTSVDLAAPGVSINSTIPNNKYGFMSGTSMAAPHVAGVAALLKSYNPYLTTSQIKSLILNNVDTISSLKGKVLTGGRLNAYRTLEAAKSYTNIMPNVSGDFNGDGKDEIAVFCVRNQTGAEIRVGTSGATVQDISNFSIKFSFDSGFPLDRVANRMVAGDFNGDGKDDIGVLYDSTMSGSGSTGSATLYTFLSTGNSFTYNKWFSFSTGFPLNRVANRITAGDFNGDGKDDIGVFYDSTMSGSGSTGSATLYTFLSTGSSFTCNNWFSFSTGFPLNRVANRITAGDFNGDGKDDIGVLYDSTMSGSGSTGSATLYTFLSTGSSFTCNNWFSFSTGFPLNRVGDRITAGDFNGDGKDDIGVLYDSTMSESGSTGSATLYTFLSTGSSFTYNKWLYLSTGYPLKQVADKISCGDFNGDGKDDISAIYYRGYNVFRLHTFTSNGASFIYGGP